VGGHRYILLAIQGECRECGEKVEGMELEWKRSGRGSQVWNLYRVYLGRWRRVPVKKAPKWVSQTLFYIQRKLRCRKTLIILTNETRT
jgi:hypothetical protein